MAAVTGDPFEPYETYPAELGFLLGHIAQLNGVRGRRKRNPVGFAAPTRKRKQRPADLPPWPDVPWMTR